MKKKKSFLLLCLLSSLYSFSPCSCICFLSCSPSFCSFSCFYSTCYFCLYLILVCLNSFFTCSCFYGSTYPSATGAAITIDNAVSPSNGDFCMITVFDAAFSTTISNGAAAAAAASTTTTAATF